MRLILYFLLMTTLSVQAAPQEFDNFSVTDEAYIEQVYDLEALLNQAEDRASHEGRFILQTSRTMIQNQEIILGSCWDYINAVYDRAGYPQKKRKTIYKSKQAGPYTDISAIEPGDWLYFINHSYNNVEHSAIFIEWIDINAKLALTVAYSGGNKTVPGRYKTYDLSSVYNIMRAKP